MCSPRPTCYPELYHPFKFQHFLSLQLTLLYLAKQECSTDLWVYTPDFWMTLCVFEVHILKSCSIICPRRIFLVTVFYVVWGKAEGCITFIYQEWEWRGNLSMAFVFKYLTSFFFSIQMTILGVSDKWHNAMMSGKCGEGLPLLYHLTFSGSWWNRLCSQLPRYLEFSHLSGKQTAVASWRHGVAQ